MSQINLVRLTILAVLIAGSNQAFTGTYDKTEVLDQTVNFELSIRKTTDTIYFGFKTDSLGWFGIGIAEYTSGFMIGGDFLAFQVSNSEVALSDRYLPWRPYPFQNSQLFPVEDDTNHWTLIRQELVSNTRWVEVSRALDTHDSQDRPLNVAEIRLLWAYGSGDSMSYHGGSTRGTKMINLDSTQAFTAPSDISGSYDYVFGPMVIPQQRTTYACESFTIANDASRHAVSFEVIVQNPQYVHHMVAYICEEDNTFFQEHLNQPGVCFFNLFGYAPGASPGGQDQIKCRTPFYAWAAGANKFYLPDAAGIPIGNGQLDVKRIMVEIHYDNPQGTTGITDTTTLRVEYANTKRTNDAYWMTFGDATVTMDPLPANSIQHHQSSCPSECSSTWSHDINVIGSFLHMHSYGRSIWANLYDTDGTFVDTVNRIDFWNANFQQGTPVNFQFRRGQRLQLHGVFDTTNSNQPIAFGPGSDEEMFMEFVLYYPMLTLTETHNNVDIEYPFAYCGANYDNDELKTLCGFTRYYTPTQLAAATQVVDSTNLEQNYVLNSNEIFNARPTVTSNTSSSCKIKLVIMMMISLIILLI